MKLIIDDFEVEVKAKFEGGERYNKEATLFFLNHLVVLAGEAKKGFEAEGAYALADSAQRAQKNIYEFCKDKGAYKEYK